MKKSLFAMGKVSKGRSGGLIISIIVHAIIFACAGAFIVFRYIQKEPDCGFEIPVRNTVKHPPEKPRLSMNKQVKPAVSSRIMVNETKVERPEYSLPDLQGDGENSGSQVIYETQLFLPADIPQQGGFVKNSIGCDLEATFYDFKYDRMKRFKEIEPTDMYEVVGKFIRDGWNPALLSKYYRSPQKRYANCIMIPASDSSVAPFAFDENTAAYCWGVHYKGTLVRNEPITFRFWGMGDDILAVRVNGKNVLNASWPSEKWLARDIIQSAMKGWQPSSGERYPLGHGWAVPGSWITLEAGVPVEFEAFIAEGPGGKFGAMLNVEERGKNYPDGRDGAPFLPMFKLAELSWGLVDTICMGLGRGESDVMNGPVFHEL